MVFNFSVGGFILLFIGGDVLLFILVYCLVWDLVGVRVILVGGLGGGGGVWVLNLSKVEWMKFMVVLELEFVWLGVMLEFYSGQFFIFCGEFYYVVDLVMGEMMVVVFIVVLLFLLWVVIVFDLFRGKVW